MKGPPVSSLRPSQGVAETLSKSLRPKSIGREVASPRLVDFRQSQDLRAGARCSVILNTAASPRTDPGAASQTFASWNQIAGWLGRLDGLDRAGDEGLVRVTFKPWRPGLPVR